MLRSMTAFASADGARDSFGWTWELRGVNGKGLDLRLRLPDWIDGLEARIRARLTTALARGNVTVSLKPQRADETGGIGVNAAGLAEALTALARIEAAAHARGLVLGPASAADLLALRGVSETAAGRTVDAALTDALLTHFDEVLAAFLAMRETEGAALGRVLGAQLDEIARLTEAAASADAARRPEIDRAFRAALARVMEAGVGADADRVAQELALLAIKADVTEEIDRLRAHVAAARALVAAGSPVGRKLDFLMQEFNREANTLCSKAQNKGLTAVGLELKTVIDRMREQVQNVE